MIEIMATPPNKEDNEQSLEMRWIPGQSGIKCYIWEGKELVFVSFHPTAKLSEALQSSFTEYGKMREDKSRD